MLPLSEQGFHQHKGEFRDVLCLRYGWTLSNIPWLCNRGKVFTIDHAMVCHMGGFPTIRHNKIRDLTASLLTEVCSNMAIEPHLQPLSGETFRLALTNGDDSMYAQEAIGMLAWSSCLDAFFDLKCIFHPNKPSNHSKTLPAMYKKREDEKKRAIWPAYTGNRAWRLHPTRTFNLRRYG